MTAEEGGKQIAIFHCPIQIIKRSVGRSAVAAAAYRSGERLTNEWDGKTHDYTHKPGVVHTEIMLPAHAPLEFQDRSTLWNSVEQIEKASDLCGGYYLPKSNRAKYCPECAVAARRKKEAERQRKRYYNSTHLGLKKS